MIPLPIVLALVVAAVATPAALIARRPAIVLPGAAAASAAWAAATVYLVTENMPIPAVLTGVPAAAGAVLAVEQLRGRRPVRRRPGRCPSWCSIDHRNPSGRDHVSHDHEVAVRELLNGDIVEVRLTWVERLTGPASGPPQVALATYDRAAGHDHITHLSGEDAASLATVMAADLAEQVEHAHNIALSGDAGWLPRALAQAAHQLGYDTQAVTH